MASINYRADIDGLRAIAVGTVLLFHAELGLAPGGFIGVDVFFVISGYLITSIIVAEASRGEFSVAGFYERRIRRIFPALLTVIVAAAAIGWLVLTPRDYMEFARSGIAAAAFYSNFFFNAQAGYFAPASETQPLLHTWSLGVEEQFYLLAPGFILLILHERLRRFRSPVFFGLLALSLGTSWLGVELEWPSAFYLLPSRAFELMTGMALALGLAPTITSRILRQTAGLTGLAMIAGAALLYSASTPFPGAAALLPCLGAALLIHSGSAGDTLAHRMLAVRPMAFAGRVSYSLYLWHWPLLAYAKYELGGQVAAQHRLALLALAFALSVLTYYWVEQPARRGRLMPTRASVFASGAAALMCCLMFAGVVVYTRGVPGRLSPEAAALARALSSRKETTSKCLPASARGNCLIGSSKGVQPTFVLWGDSHAQMLSKSLSELAGSVDLKGHAVLRGGCPPFFLLETEYKDEFRKCHSSLRRVPRLIEAQEVVNVIIMARWASYAEYKDTTGERAGEFRLAPGDQARNREEFARLLRGTIERLRAPGRTVTLIGPVPELPVNLPTAMIRGLMRGHRQDLSLPFADFARRQATVLGLLAELSKLPGVRVLYPHRLLCSAERCRTVEAGRPLYVDDDHLSPLGVEALGPLLREAMLPPPGKLRIGFEKRDGADAGTP
ncbi:MAG: acyltransferase [Hyphomicrobiaceae bacterium]|nr:acyltransferase [Hyphomicrobiaceae bacterium]